MIIAISLIAAIALLLLESGRSKTITRKGLITGNLKHLYQNFASAIADTHHSFELICDNNQKLVYRVLPVNQPGKITGEFLHTLGKTKYGHYVMATFIDEKGNVSKSRKLYFETEQPEKSYAEAMVLLCLPFATKAFNNSLYNTQVPSAEFPNYSRQQHKFA